MYESGIKFGSSRVESVSSCLKTKQRKKQITIRTAKQEARQSRKGTAPSAKTGRETETERDKQTETERHTDRDRES